MRVTILGSGNVGSLEDDYKAAYEVSYRLALQGVVIVNGGGKGIMEASSLGANDAGGETIGIVLRSRQIETSFNTKIDVAITLFERLQKLVEGSDAYIFFKGGTGTLAEIGVIWDLINKGLIQAKQMIFYKDYWNPLIELLKNEPAYHGGYASQFILFADSVDKIINSVDFV